MNNKNETENQHLAAEAKKLERECLKFQKCFMQFAQMQKELARYGELAETDARIKQKLEDLHSLLPGGLSQIKETFHGDISKLNLSLRQLDAQLKKALAQDIAMRQQSALQQSRSSPLSSAGQQQIVVSDDGVNHQLESTGVACKPQQNDPVEGVAGPHQGNK